MCHPVRINSTHGIICFVLLFKLCEAGEEEFLEIMALVGMASKPLHVRRLQKALQDWVQNPGRQTGKKSLKSWSPGLVIFVILLLLTTSAWLCLQHTRNLRTAF